MSTSDWTSAYFGTITAEEEERLLQEVAQQLSQTSSFRDLVDVDSLLPRARQAVVQTAARMKLSLAPDTAAALSERAAARVGGLGFLVPFFRRDDISEIALNPDGSLWVLPKGQRDFVPAQADLEPNEVWRAVEALLRPMGRALSEASPTVDGKLPRIETLPGLRGGARVKVLHPSIVPSRAGYPSINIRLFEPVPVTPERVVAWGVAPQIVIKQLLQAVRDGLRVLVCGGTASGKTTLLSALTAGIPPDARVVKIEDPEEIWMQHPNVVTIEARPALPGSSVAPYTIANGVDDALRMAPRWLIVGEVRTGDAAMALFRAQMSDHPGLSTFHAESPQHAVERMSLIMFADSHVPAAAAKGIFAQAVDLVVQLGWADGRRCITTVAEVSRQLKGGDVVFNPLYEIGAEEMTPPSIRRTV